ncbi:MAG: cation:proton antiporter [Nannocystaceae bacterium]
MNATLLLVLLVVFSFAISRLLSRYASKYFVVSGVEYLLLGIILGPMIPPTVLTHEALDKFAPLIDLLLGLVGFLLGLRARSSLRPANVALGGAFSSLALIAMVAAAILGLLEYLGHDSHAVRYQLFAIVLGDNLLEAQASSGNLALALTIGCAAAVSSPVLIAQSATLHRARGPALDTLLGYGMIGQLVAIAVFGVTLAWARAAESADVFRIPIGLWAAVTVAAGILIGLLFNLFIGRDRDEMKIYVAALGSVIFAAGTGSALGVSPLVVNLIAGFVVSFTSRHAQRLEVTLTPVRHPILVLLRLFAGALWVPIAGLVWLLWLLPPLYVATRFLARWFTTWASTWLFRKIPRVPRLGFGLVGQGGLAVAIAVSYAQRFPETAPIALTTILGGILLSDLWSYKAVRRILADAGEIDTAIDDDPAGRTQIRPRPPLEEGP